MQKLEITGGKKISGVITISLTIYACQTKYDFTDKGGYLLGFTDNYIRIKIPFTDEICRTKQQVKLIVIDSATAGVVTLNFTVPVLLPSRITKSPATP